MHVVIVQVIDLIEQRVTDRSVQFVALKLETEITTSSCKGTHTHTYTNLELSFFTYPIQISVNVTQGI